MARLLLLFLYFYFCLAFDISTNGFECIVRVMFAMHSRMKNVRQTSSIYIFFSILAHRLWNIFLQYHRYPISRQNMCWTDGCAITILLYFVQYLLSCIAPLSVWSMGSECWLLFERMDLFEALCCWVEFHMTNASSCARGVSKHKSSTSSFNDISICESLFCCVFVCLLENVCYWIGLIHFYFSLSFQWHLSGSTRTMRTSAAGARTQEWVAHSAHIWLQTI